MFGGLVLAMLIGYPVAFTLAAVGLSFGFLSIHLGFFDLNFLQAIPGRVFGSVLSNELLLAIPFFTFMGAILERCGLAEDMLDSMGQLFGPVRGGLGYSVIIVGFILGAITGTVAAQVIAMALISMPVMIRYGYNMRYITGVLAASGTITQLVPPSLVLIVLADQMGASVGDFYEGALFPGLGLAVAYAVWVMIVSIVKPSAAPACPEEARTHYGMALVGRVFTTMVPPLVLIFLVLGTIFLGVATPTEGGAMGASGAIIMALVKRKLSFSLLKQALESTAEMTSFVMFILVGSTVFSLVFRGVDGDLWVEHLLTSVPGGALGFLIVVNALIFFLAFFLDYFEIAFIMVPLLTPVAQKLGIDIVWFGVLLAVNMQTSFLHPPFGFALFYLRSVAPKSVKTSDIYWGAVPFVVIQVLMVATIIAFPQVVTGNISKAPGAIKGSGAEELRRQLEGSEPVAPSKESSPKEAPKPDDSGSELERLLKQQQ
jgi:tripartite ATP-independent transporter DctM subunit